MKSSTLFLTCLMALTLRAQEATSGFELRATLSGMAAASEELTEKPRAGLPVDAGLRLVLYPVWKLNNRWTLTGAYQAMSRPYFFESFSTQGYGLKGSLLQATLNYSRVSRNRSMVLRFGMLSTAFGSFLLHYDDASNSLVDLPAQYGYYYAAVSILPVAGAELDLTGGKWDGRLQVANSSPSNPRGPFARDQYVNLSGGGGYTIRQGFRIGGSSYYGPYLDRESPYYFPGEASPSALSAHGWGLDAQWGAGHWNLQGEWQKLTFPYTVIPTFREQAAYIEAKRVLHPRWYVAARAGTLLPSLGGETTTLETAAVYRPTVSLQVKFDYEWQRISQNPVRYNNIVAVQVVATLRPLALAFR